MGKTIVIAYMCDSHHSHSSMSFFGVYTTYQKAIKAVCRYDNLVTSQEVAQLKQHRQTQGLEQNYVLNSAILNE